MNFTFSAREGLFEEALKDILREINEAQAGAVQDVAAEAVKEGRANIASAGFPRRWQDALTYRFYPNEGKDPAALIYDRIRFAGVFERGIIISGRPLLWLPIEANLPAGVHSPKQYRHKLVSVNVTGKPPLMFDAFRRDLGPLFVGVPQVSIRKRFDLYRIFHDVISRMQEFYAQRIKG